MESKRLIYLDNAATTFPKPKGILDKMVAEYAGIGVSPGRGSYDLAAAAEDAITKARRTLARFFNAPDHRRVIFTANATDSLNLAILGFLKPGDHAITTCLEHNSVLRPLYHLQQTGQITVSTVPFDGQGYIDPADIERAIGPKTRLVVVNHASNVLGTVQPVSAVGDICAAHGVALLVDASQSAGQVTVDMEAMGASAVAFTGHKSLYGPTGTGGLVLRPDMAVMPVRFGGTGVESKSMVHTMDFPHRLEAGTHNLMGILGLRLAVEDLQAERVATIHAREMKLTRQLVDGFKALDGITVYGADSLDRHLAVVTVNVDGVDPMDVGAILDADFDIAVRVGLHCAPLVHAGLGTGDRGAVRFSLGRFNTEADIDRAIDAMARIAML
jgi:cysteine desulfurase / selenocysteine lyase